MSILNQMHPDLAKQTERVSLFTLDGQTSWAKCVGYYDGDSIHIVMLFNGHFTRFRCRLKGIDTAELRSKDAAEKTHAKKARDYLKDRIVGQIVLVRCGRWDKYGRLLVTVFLPNNADTTTTNTEACDVDLASLCTNINNELVHKHLAYAYKVIDAKRSKSGRLKRK